MFTMILSESFKHNPKKQQIEVVEQMDTLIQFLWSISSVLGGLAFALSLVSDGKDNFDDV